MYVFVAKRVMRWSFNRAAKEDLRVQMGRKEGNWPWWGGACPGEDIPGREKHRS